MKKFLLLIFLLSLGTTYASEQNSTIATVHNPLTVPQQISFENCTKMFGINQEKLFYLTLASLSANRFLIEEVQTSDGYIIFSVNKNRYLATVAKIDGTNSILKITPCDNVYNFPPGILLGTFKYIDINTSLDID